MKGLLGFRLHKAFHALIRQPINFFLNISGYVFFNISDPLIYGFGVKCPPTLMTEQKLHELQLDIGRSIL